MNNLSNSSNTSQDVINTPINFEQKIQELERQRENDLLEIRNRLSLYRYENNDNDTVEYELTYSIDEPFNQGSFDQEPQVNLFENMINLLRFVNNVSDVNNFNGFENLMEPVRVTVNEDKMDTFLTSIKYDPKVDELKIKDQKSCTICLSNYEKDEEVSYLNTCGHLFHTTCVDKWLREFNHKCPVCRLSADPSKNSEIAHM